MVLVKVTCKCKSLVTMLRYILIAPFASLDSGGYLFPPLPLLLLIKCPHTSKVNDMFCSTSISIEHFFSYRKVF